MILQPLAVLQVPGRVPLPVPVVLVLVLVWGQLRREGLEIVGAGDLRGGWWASTTWATRAS